MRVNYNQCIDIYMKKKLHTLSIKIMLSYTSLKIELSNSPAKYMYMYIIMPSPVTGLSCSESGAHEPPKPGKERLTIV